MLIDHSGHRYTTIMGSDLERDGMFLELLVDGRSQAPPLVAFYSDVTGEFALETLEKTSIPFEVIDAFLQEARQCLPPASATPQMSATPTI
jgi:hypothetical protein